MGRKVNPVGMRTGIIRSWNSSWYANKRNYAKMLSEDIQIRRFITKKLNDMGVAYLELQRNANDFTINIHTAKPGVIIGRQGAGVEGLKATLEKKFGHKFTLNVKEIKKPDLEARLIADSVANQIERRVSYRRASKMAVKKAMDAGAVGVKIRVGGRLNGVEISRSEFVSEGRIPLHTFRANIDFAHAEANTTYGVIGVKVWVNKGEVFHRKPVQTAAN